MMELLALNNEFQTLWFWLIINIRYVINVLASNRMDIWWSF